MSKNLLINGVTYNGIESMEIPDTTGEKVVFVPEDEAGVELPDLGNYSATAEDIVLGKKAIDADGNVIDGELPVYFDENTPAAVAEITTIIDGDCLGYFTVNERKVYDPSVPISFVMDASVFGNAEKGDVRSGYTFTSKNGFAKTGTAEFGSSGDDETVFYTYVNWGDMVKIKMRVPYDGITWREYITYDEFGIDGAYVEYDLGGNEQVRVGNDSVNYPVYLNISSPDSLVPIDGTTGVWVFIP